MKVALVYDRVNKFGGAERVLQVLHELYPDAPLFTSVYNKPTAKWAHSFTVIPTFLQYIPFAKTNHEYIAALEPIAYEALSFDDFDLVISITSEFAKGILTKPKTLHICYCLTPTRYLWSGYETYFENLLLKFLSAPLVSYLKKWDLLASKRPDHYLAISDEVAKRVKTYYKQDAQVIYPPVSFTSFEASEQIESTPLPKKYFLLVSRLVAYKRIEIAIEAFNRLGWPLVIVGSGREFARLRKLAYKNITFLQNLTDSELSRYYQNCTAFLFPGSEDFGLTILEAQSFGKPVIAYRSGGALETIKEKKTGEFFFPATASALVEKLKQFRPKKYSPKECQEQARKFSKEIFKERFSETINELWKNHQNNYQSMH